MNGPDDAGFGNSFPKGLIRAFPHSGNLLLRDRAGGAVRRSFVPKGPARQGGAFPRVCAATFVLLLRPRSEEQQFLLEVRPALPAAVSERRGAAPAVGLFFVHRVL